jgi:hypothetical protein
MQDVSQPIEYRRRGRANAKLRGPGERANAQLKSWRILRNSAAAPGRPDNWPKPSTSFRSASAEDENALIYSYFSL